MPQDVTLPQMTPLVTTDEMRRLEGAANAAGVTYAAMMESAGAAVAREIASRYPPANQGVVVLVGPGNNGGDGLVAARHLHDLGAKVTTYLSRPRDASDANLRLAQERGVTILLASDDPDGAGLTHALNGASVVVDALLGTGISRPVEGAVQRILHSLAELLNSTEGLARRTVVAVDFPSGLNADTGAVDPATPHADFTVTFAFPKRGHLLFPGAGYLGELVVADIGIDRSLAAHIAVTLATASGIRELLPLRPRDANKGTFGRALVIAGCANYTGAALLASMAAARAGAGLVSLACCASLLPIFASRLLETVFLPLAEDEPGCLGTHGLPTLLDALPGHSATLLGPGLGQRPSTSAFVRELVGRLTLPYVIDADALNALANLDSWWKELPAGGILTPHPGEFARLARLTIPQVQADRLGLALSSAGKWGQVVVLKGANTVVAGPDGQACVIPFANPGLATAGSGDVLAGAMVGLLAQGVAPFQAAVAGAYLHGLAGELAAADIGETGMVASDLLPMLPQAIRRLAPAGRAPAPPLSRGV